MSFAEDLAPFFADMGVDATLSGKAVRGIFDNAHDVAGLGARGMVTTVPQYTLATASVPSQPHGAALVVPGQGNFRVVEHQPDGTGLSVLVLERAA